MISKRMKNTSMITCTKWRTLTCLSNTPRTRLTAFASSFSSVVCMCGVAKPIVFVLLGAGAF